MQGHLRAVVIVVCASLASAAQADNRDEARRYFAQAAQQFELGEYKQALDSFKQAYRQVADPSFLYNIAQCYRLLGDKEQAMHLYRNYLTKVPDAANRDEVRRTIATLQSELAEERAARPASAATTTPPPTAEPAPHPDVTPSPSPSSAEATNVVARAPEHARTPVYKKWWLWTAAGVVVVGAAVGIGVGVSLSRHPTASTDFGTVKF